MAAWTAVSRQAGQLSRICSPKIANGNPQAFSMVHRRGLAGGGDHHGPPKVNCWQDPMSPSKWKEEHFVIVSLSGWGLLIYSGYEFFTGGKKETKEEILKSAFRRWLKYQSESFLSRMEIYNKAVSFGVTVECRKL